MGSKHNRKSTKWFIKQGTGWRLYCWPPLFLFLIWCLCQQLCGSKKTVKFSVFFEDLSGNSVFFGTEMLFLPFLLSHLSSSLSFLLKKIGDDPNPPVRLETTSLWRNNERLDCRLESESNINTHLSTSLYQHLLMNTSQQWSILNKCFKVIFIKWWSLLDIWYIFFIHLKDYVSLLFNIWKGKQKSTVIGQMSSAIDPWIPRVDKCFWRIPFQQCIAVRCRADHHLRQRRWSNIPLSTTIVRWLQQVLKTIEENIDINFDGSSSVRAK